MIFIAEGMHSDGINVLESRGFRVVTPGSAFKKEEIQAILVRSVFEITESTLKEYPNVKVVGKLGTGLDNIDLEFCKKRGIVVINAPSMNAKSTAEFALMLFLSTVKNYIKISQSVNARDFRRMNYYGRECSEMTVSIIGFGSVGTHLAHLLSSLVDRVCVRDRNFTERDNKSNIFFVSDLESFLPECDAVFLALSLKGNLDFVDKHFLSRLKEDVIIINVARGGLINEIDMVNFLRANPKAVYCCDVLSVEPDYALPPEKQTYTNDLLDLPNVFYTPHIAGLTDFCQSKIAVFVANKTAEAIALAHRKELEKVG